jgi:carbon monoxide dehydrogenase subunit G
VRINVSTRVEVPPRAVWDYITDFENYLGFVAGLTRWEPAGDETRGIGARFRVLFRVGAADVGGLIEIVEWDEERDIAFTSVTGLDQRGRWRVREERDGATRVEFRWAYGVAGAGIAGLIAERLAAPRLRRDLRQSLENLKRNLEERSPQPSRAVR